MGPSTGKTSPGGRCWKDNEDTHTQRHVRVPPHIPTGMRGDAALLPTPGRGGWVNPFCLLTCRGWGGGGLDTVWVGSPPRRAAPSNVDPPTHPGPAGLQMLRSAETPPRSPLYPSQDTEKGGGSPTPFPPGKRGIAGRGCLREVGSSRGLFGEGVGSESGQEKCRARQEGDETIRRLRAEPGGDVVIFVLVVLFCFPGDWDNSWSGLFIPVGNTSLYGLQDAVGGSGTKRASNVKVTGPLPLFMLLLMTGLAQPWPQPCCMALVLT